jgi:hypothetical protein
MYSIHIDESVILVKAARPSRLCVLFMSSQTVCLTVWITSARCTVFEATLLNAGAGTDVVPITIAARRFLCYKYLLVPCWEPTSFLLSLVFLLLRVSLSRTLLSNNGGQVRPEARTLSLREGSPTPSDAKTPPLAPSGSPPPLGSPLEVSSHRPRSPVFEHGVPPGRLLWWICLHLRMRANPSLTLLATSSLPNVSSVSSTILF